MSEKSHLIERVYLNKTNKTQLPEKSGICIFALQTLNQ